MHHQRKARFIHSFIHSFIHAFVVWQRNGFVFVNIKFLSSSYNDYSAEHAVARAFVYFEWMPHITSRALKVVTASAVGLSPRRRIQYVTLLIRLFGGNGGQFGDEGGEGWQGLASWGAALVGVTNTPDPACAACWHPVGCMIEFRGHVPGWLIFTHLTVQPLLSSPKVRLKRPLSAVHFVPTLSYCPASSRRIDLGARDSRPPLR